MRSHAHAPTQHRTMLSLPRCVWGVHGICFRCRSGGELRAARFPLPALLRPPALAPPRSSPTPPRPWSPSPTQTRPRTHARTHARTHLHADANAARHLRRRRRRRSRSARSMTCWVRPHPPPPPRLRPPSQLFEHSLFGRYYCGRNRPHQPFDHYYCGAFLTIIILVKIDHTSLFDHYYCGQICPSWSNKPAAGSVPRPRRRPLPHGLFGHKLFDQSLFDHSPFVPK